MKKIIFSALFILIYSYTSYSQSFQWVRYYTSSVFINSNLFVCPSISDAFGNHLMASLYNYKLNYNSNGYGDVIIHKFNNAGSEIFSKIFNGKAFIDNIQTDPQGNIYVSGGFMDTLWIDSVNYILNTGNGLNVNYFLVKLNGSGNFVWKKNMSTANFTYLNAFKIKNGFLYAGIYLASSQQGIIKKFDLDGNELISIQENSVRGISDIDVDARGDIYAAGACSCCNLQFGNLSASSPFTYNEYYVKYNPDGLASWVKFVQDVTFQTPNLVSDANGNVFICGQLNGAFMFGNIQSIGPQWVYDFFISKIDSSGSFQWLKEIPHTESITGDAGIGRLKSISINSQDDIFFTGFLRGTMNWGNNVITTSAGGTDVLVLKYNSNGNILWGKTAGGISDDRGDAISIDNQGNAFISGNFYGTAMFDTITALGSGAINPFAALLRTTVTNVQNISSKIPERTSLSQNFPNPFNPSTTIKFSLPNPSEGGTMKVTLKIYDILGKEIASLIPPLWGGQEGLQPGSYQVVWDASNYPSGVYFYKLSTTGGTEDFSETKKLILLK